MNPEKTVNEENNQIAIPIFIIFRALGIETDKSIVEYISGNATPEPNTIEY